MSDPLLAFRAEFPILEETVYLISNSLGAMPRAAETALADYARTWRTRGVRAWADGWWRMSLDVGDEIAPLIGAVPGSIAMLPSVTVAQAVVLSALEYRPPRDRILLIEGEFPSVAYVYEGLAGRLGARVEVLPSPGGDGLAADEKRIAAAIDERTAVVCLSHVLFKSAYLLDLAPILLRAREAGAIVVVDGYQSVGTVPVDVSAQRIPVLVGGVLKWLCGGPGAAFLYVDPELASRLRPALTGWFAHKRPFAFEDAMDPLDGAGRFLLGTPSIPSLYAAREGPRILRAAGMPAVREKSLRQTDRLMRLADERGMRVASPRLPSRRGGTVSIDFPNSLEVSRELNDRDVCVDYRPGVGIRLSPHFYSRDDELDRAFEEIDAIRTAGSWRRWADRPAVVT